MKVNSARYIISSPSVDSCPKADKPEYAFIGRSNVGKSSLINMLCNNQKLAKTSATPGKTQLINHFEIVSDDNKKWFLTDLPGYGYAKTSQRSRRRWEQMIEDYLRKRENLISVFVLIDSRHAPQPIDLEFINRMGEWQVPFAIVFTKTDKNKPGATQRNADAFLGKMKESWETLPVYFFTSAVSGTGKNEMLEYIGRLNNEFNFHIR